MKKTLKMMWAALLLALPMMMVSCDDEPYWHGYNHYYNNYGGNQQRPNNGGNGGAGGGESASDFYVDMAKMLAGQWRGELMAYEIDSAGEVIDSLLYSTDIEFEQYNEQSISGTGTQYDYEVYYDAANQQHMASEPDVTNFTWYIDPSNGTIYLTYKEVNDDKTTSDYVMTIAYEDLDLNERTFTGYLKAVDGSEIDGFLFDRYQDGSNAKAALPTHNSRKAVALKLVMR